MKYTFLIEFKCLGFSQTRVEYILINYYQIHIYIKKYIYIKLISIYEILI